ncbi:MAG: LytTR family DNA-binding domain-containing protein [Verrucomicrobia bacterium]|nr:LytTR family DNA-binding domain-containing protein [Verrucomicrobiota bacterium]
MKYSCLIIDDEALARQRLATLLRDHAQVEVVGQCADGKTAVETIEALKPDFVFLDVQMPELDGFEVVETLGTAQMPLVIFVTAHDQFALKAFEVNAVDYLLKPFDRERFDLALGRVLETLRRRDPEDLEQRMTKLLADLQPRPRSLDRLVIKTDGKVRFIRFEDIDWAEADDNYVAIHTGNESHLIRETMLALEKKLPAAQFLRVSRSSLINVGRIREMQPLFHGEYVIILKSGAKVTLSRSYRDRLQRLLGKTS